MLVVYVPAKRERFPFWGNNNNNKKKESKIFPLTQQRIKCGIETGN